MILSWAGKGSAGKTSIVMAGLRQWAALGWDGPTLVVDADPNQSLTETAGWQGVSVGSIRSALERAMHCGELTRPDETVIEAIERIMTTQLIHPTMIGDAVVDVVSLGRWDLDGSQCTTNRALLRGLLHVAASYRTVVIDHEAGLEHLGRYASLPQQLLVVVTTPRPMFRSVTHAIIRTARTVARIASIVLVGNMVHTPDEWEREVAAIQAIDPDVVPMRSILPLASTPDPLHDPRWLDAATALWHELRDYRASLSPAPHGEQPPTMAILPPAVRESITAWLATRIAPPRA